MDDIRLACSSSQGMRIEGDGLYTDVHSQILQLLCSRLDEDSMMVMQEQLQLMQRSSYYLEVERDALVLPADQHEQDLSLSDSTLWSLIDQQRLQRTVTLANTQVKLLLTVLGLLYEETVRGCRDMEDFIIKYDSGSVDRDMAVLMQQKLKQTHQYVNDFKKRITRNLGPLHLQNQLITNTGNFPRPQLQTLLVIKMPVVFDRFESCARSNSVYLSWDIAGKQSKVPDQLFEIHIHSLHPTVDQQQQISKSVCQSYSIEVNNLTSDTCYQFSVKRADAVNLVYGLWIDTMILKTLGI